MDEISLSWRSKEREAGPAKPFLSNKLPQTESFGSHTALRRTGVLLPKGLRAPEKKRAWDCRKESGTAHVGQRGDRLLTACSQATEKYRV